MFSHEPRDTAFKCSLKKVLLATEATIRPAASSFNLHKNRAKPAVFLAGGIGITPFLSIARQAHHDRLPHKLYLYYSNRRPEDAPFLDTLQNLAKTNPDFHLICTMTEMSKSKEEWRGETVPSNRIHRDGANVGTNELERVSLPANQSANPLTILHATPYKLSAQSGPM